MSELNLTSENFDQETASGVVMVDFGAEWCGPCKMIAPLIEELASEYQGKAKIFKVNIEEAPEIASRFQIMSIPALIFLKDGELQGQIIGAQPKEALKAELDKLI